MTGSIPDWEPSGLLPTMSGDDQISPHRASLIDVLARFGHTSHRASLLENFIKYRAELHALGLTNGFQWINGSFVQDVERTENRDPKDIDVVTFFRSDGRAVDRAKAEAIASRKIVKATFHLDAILVSLGNGAEVLVESASYWTSQWGHTRQGLWKGFVQVDLSPQEEAKIKAAADVQQQETSRAQG